MTVLSRRRFLSTTGLFALAGMMPNLRSDCIASDSFDTDLQAFVGVSRRDSRYFELSNGKPYIPIGLNMISPPWGDDEELTKLENDWFKKLHENKANFVRIWLSCEPYEIEREKSGNIDPVRVKKLDKLFALARKYGIRLKLCTEHFRTIEQQNNWWSARPMHRKENGGPAENKLDLFTNEAGKNWYKKKLDFYAEHYGDDPIVFGWELWNEMDAVGLPSDVLKNWTQEMLAELHRRFPKNLCMQSLGSFDADYQPPRYKMLCDMPGNDVMQVHRYLDLGAPWTICHAPVAELAADATKTMLQWRKRLQPVLLAESGAVEPKHTGPFKLYEKDEDGIIFHDVLFAPFFVGAAGPGHIWHWDHYVHKNDLWHHLKRFANAVEGLDPAAEAFEPFKIQHDRLLVYGLKGKTKTMLWCRDRENTWKTELEEEKTPEKLANLEIDLSEIEPVGKKTRTYDPWEDRWTDATKNGSKVVLPPFARSIVLKISS